MIIFCNEYILLSFSIFFFYLIFFCKIFIVDKEFFLNLCNVKRCMFLKEM